MSSSEIQQANVESGASRTQDFSRLMRRLHTGNTIGLVIIWSLAILVAVLFIAILFQLVFQGFAYRGANNLPLLLDPAFYGTGKFSIGPQIFNTFYVLILSELLLFPIALAAALYTVEYAKQGPFITIIRFAAETLAGVPSIVLGLFGFVLFAQLLHFQQSRLSGALTLLCLNFPLALRLFEDALTSVPRELREASLALGSTRWHTIRTVVLPAAIPGLITGLILSAGKILGETAALIFTMGQNNPFRGVFTLDPQITSDNLTIHLWALQVQELPSGMTRAQGTAIAAASATILIVILLIINISARAIGRSIQRRVSGS